MSYFLQSRGNHSKHFLKNITEHEWSKRSIHPGVKVAKPERPSQRSETGCPKLSHSFYLAFIASYLDPIFQTKVFRPTPRQWEPLSGFVPTSVSRPSTQKSSRELPRAPQTHPSTHPLITGYYEQPTSNALLRVAHSVLKMTIPIS